MFNKLLSDYLTSYSDLLDSFIQFTLSFTEDNPCYYIIC